MSIYQDALNMLPDIFNKQDDTITAKIIKIFAEQLDEVRATLDKIELWRSVDNAEGVVLDFIGQAFNQSREGTLDTEYRILIKSKILRDRSDGTINTLIKNIAFLLGQNESDVLIKSMWEQGQSATLYAELELGETKLTVERYAEIFNSITSAGVGMDIYFVGSFMFAEEYDVMQIDEEHGFGEIVSDQQYHQGDFTFSSLEVSETDELKGFSSDDLGVGGAFGAYYLANENKMKAW